VPPSAGNLCPERGQQAFPKLCSVSTEMYDVTSGNFKEKVEYFYLKS